LDPKFEIKKSLAATLTADERTKWYDTGDHIVDGWYLWWNDLPGVCRTLAKARVRPPQATIRRCSAAKYRAKNK